MPEHEKINYLEIPARDLLAAQSFFNSVFNWTFIDYGQEYCAFSDQGIDGGFYQSDHVMSTDNGSALIVFYSDQLEQTLHKVKQAGGKIIKPVFAFPGGRRFHFNDPNGNEFAVWSDY